MAAGADAAGPGDRERDPRPGAEGAPGHGDDGTPGSEDPASAAGTAPAADAEPRRTSDRTLLAAFVLHQEGGLFTLLVERHQGDLLKVASAILGDAEAAQDAVQEAFVRLGREAASVLKTWPPGRDSVGGWLVTVVRHWCIDRLRQRRLSALDREELVHGGPSPAVAAATRDSEAAVWRAVDALPPVERAAVVLRYRDGMSYQEIAARLGKSATHVGVILHQALGRLRGVALLREEAGA